jgi:hypothetical protein
MARAVALQPNEWAAVAGVFVVILAVFAYNQVKARTRPIRAASEADGNEDHSVSPLLSRFAVHHGDVVGETVAVHKDRLILKQAGVFKAVPLAAATLDGEEVRIGGDVDWKAAEKEGAAWLEQSRTGVDESVSGDLTRSQDVRNPAREAFEKRQAETAPASDEEE